MNYYVLYDTYGVGGYEFLYHCMKRLCCMCVCVNYAMINDGVLSD